MTEMGTTWFQGHLMELTALECRDLLASGEVGRVAFAAGDDVDVFPLNYAISADPHDPADGPLMVLLRTTPHGSLAQHARGANVAFEVDEIDPVNEAGWSVLVHGRLRFLRADELPDAPSRPVPWVSGARTLHVAIEMTSISGRRLLPG